MKPAKLSKEEKAAELKRYRDLVMATLDYWIHTMGIAVKTADFDSTEHLTSLKTQTEEHFEKGRLTTLKQWFRDLTEPYIETKDLGFNKYLQEKTGYDIDIFQSYFDRVEKIVAKGAITTDNQFYDIGIMVDQLSHVKPLDEKRISQLNKLIVDYENRKSRKKEVD
jgi:hypothetical protein